MALNMVARKTATWANSAGANTEVDVNIDFSELPQSLISKYLVLVHNPSAVSAITGTIKTRFTDDAGVARAATKRTTTPADETIVAAAATTRGFVVEGFHAAQGGRITLKNDTVLGVGDGFTAKVEVWSL